MIADAAPPTILDVTPRGVAPDGTREIVIRGTELSEITQVWTSFPAQPISQPIGETETKADQTVAPMPVDPLRYHGQLTVAADVPVGVGAIRVATKAGVSPWQLLMIDDLPTLTEANVHDQISNAQDLPWPVAVDGSSDALKSDFYRLELDTETELSFEVVAQRIGSPLDSVLTLFNEQGELLQRSDDHPSSGADSRFVFRFPQAGIYYLSLRDVQHRGGEAYRYRLRVGRFPLIQCAYPLGCDQETLGEVQFVSDDASMIAASDHVIGRVESAPVGQVSLSLKLPAHDASGFTTISADDSAATLHEQEPNDEREQATKLSLPSIAYGRFDAAQDVDFYHWSVDTGQRVEVTAESQRYGSSADVYLRLWSPSGAMLAEASSQGVEPARLTYTATEAGEVFLSAEDVLQRGGAEYAYRLAIDLNPPAFTMATDVDTLNVAQNGTLIAKLTINRSGYNGPIELSLQHADGDALQDLELEQAVIAADAKTHEVKAQLPAAWVPGELHRLRLVGKAGEIDNSPPQIVSTLPAIQARGVDVFRVPQFLDGEIVVGITSAETEKK